MPKLIDLVAKLAEVCRRHQIPFALGGALANNYWGVVRATLDIDCLIAIPALKYQVFADELAILGCNLRDAAGNELPVSVIGLREQIQKQKFVECFCDSVRIEFFVPAVPLQHEILRRAVPITLAGISVPVTSAEDLVLIKMAFHRAKDLQDVRGILWVQRGRLDLSYITDWSKRSLDPDVQKELNRLIVEYSRDERV